MLLAGALFGVLLNELLPSVIILVVLVIVLTFGTIRTGKRAWRISKNEKKRTMSRTATMEQAKGSGDASPRGTEVEMTTTERVAGDVQHMTDDKNTAETP